MGRPVKNGLDYFPVDVDIFSDKKMRHISAAFGLQGEAVALHLLCNIYRNGGFMPWRPEDFEMFALDLAGKMSPEEIEKIVSECLKRGFFDSGIFEKYGVLTSNGIQKRYLFALRSEKRKKVFPVEYRVSAEETAINAEETNKIKEETRAFKSFSTDKEKDKEKEKGRETPVFAEEMKQPETAGFAENNGFIFYETIVKNWIAFYQKKIGSAPNVLDYELNQLEEIAEKICRRLQDKKILWNELNAGIFFTDFLHRAFADEWLKKHFLLSNLNKQFDAIVSNIQPLTQFNRVANFIPTEILFAEYCNGANIFSKITARHYDEMPQRIRLTPEIIDNAIAKRVKELQTSNTRESVDLVNAYSKWPETNGQLNKDAEYFFDLCKRIAVLHYFEHKKNNNHVSGNELKRVAD